MRNLANWLAGWPAGSKLGVNQNIAPGRIIIIMAKGKLLAKSRVVRNQLKEYNR